MQIHYKGQNLFDEEANNIIDAWKRHGNELSVCSCRNLFWTFYCLSYVNEARLFKSVFSGGILNPVEHLQWSFLGEIFSGFYLLIDFAKKLHRRCLSGF